MEALIEIETAERILIHENIQEIERITSDIEMRCSMLNSISKHGLSEEEIKNVSSSKGSIERFIENRLQAENPEYKRMVQAGISGITAKLSNELQGLKDALLRLEAFNPGRGGNKFENLTFTDKWVVDEIELEGLFIRNRVKIYIEGEKINEFRELEKLCSILHFIKMPSNQVKDSSVLWARIEPMGSDQYKPRWQWFARER